MIIDVISAFCFPSSECLEFVNLIFSKPQLLVSLIFLFSLFCLIVFFLSLDSIAWYLRGSSVHWLGTAPPPAHTCILVRISSRTQRWLRSFPTRDRVIENFNLLTKLIPFYFSLDQCFDSLCAILFSHLGSFWMWTLLTTCLVLCGQRTQSKCWPPSLVDLIADTFNIYGLCVFSVAHDYETICKSQAIHRLQALFVLSCSLCAEPQAFQVIKATKAVEPDKSTAGWGDKPKLDSQSTPRAYLRDTDHAPIQCLCLLSWSLSHTPRSIGHILTKCPSYFVLLW